MAAVFFNKANPTVLITGANRGIGLNLAKVFYANNFNVIGTSRSTEPAAIQDLSAVAAAILPLDVSSVASIDELPSRVKAITPSLDVVVNNAGIFEQDGIGHLTSETFTNHFKINSIAPALISQAMLPLLRASPRAQDRGHAAKVVQITSRMGSIADNGSGGYYGYRASKAALNAINMSFARDVPDVTFVSVHPGYVQTRMTGGKGDISPEDSAKLMYQVISKVNDKDSGKFLTRDGKDIPW
ncbi:short chain dehydrogenase family protein [Catenaria anguillulae PL171]|uniref:Short chain dehydrogenase family protein n=1 Tax=Catenaria anguillulae PL171 TaxID=765915 RepID=A0A1Y2HW32_9FUNG|nr:short chain dehydrogenase family protein [Catenaria anguillulae PL171]